MNNCSSLLRIGFAIVMLSALCTSSFAQSPVAIQYDQYVVDSISPSVEIDKYTFSGTAGEHIAVRVHPGTDYVTIKLELYSPSGVLDTMRTAYRAQANLIDYTLKATGTYTIYVSELEGDAKFLYSLNLQSREQVKEVAKPISYDTYVLDSIAPTGDMDGYTFSGTAGEHITVRAHPGTDYVTINLELYSPSGVLDTMRTAYRAQANLIDYTLKATGTYTIYVSELEGDAKFLYSLSLQSREQVKEVAKPISYDTYVLDSIAPTGDMDGYTFSGTAGEHITVRAHPGTDYVTINLELYSPSGVLDTMRTAYRAQANLIDYTLKATGTYTIYISELEGDAKFLYSLNLQCREQVKINAKSIVFDTSIVDTIQKPGDIQGIVFNATTGDHISIRIKPSSSVSSVFQLVAPNGLLLHDSTTASGTLNQVNNLTLSQTGRYTVFVYGSTGTETFNYTAGFYALTWAHDAGVAEIIKPDSIVEPNTSVQPSVLIKNYGTTNDTISAYFTIGLTYVDSLKKYLNANQTDTIQFKQWLAPANGTYVASCSLSVAGETQMSNNAKKKNISVGVIGNASILGISPNKAGNTGYIVAVIRGKGFMQGLRLQLRKGSESIIPDTNLLHVDSKGEEIRVGFDLRGKSLGKWDIVVVNPGCLEVVFYQGFTIISGISQVNISINAPDVQRVNRDQVITIEVQNAGTNDEIGVPVVIEGFPAGTAISVISPTLPRVTEAGPNIAVPQDLPIAFSSNEGNQEIPLMIPYLAAGEKMAIVLSTRVIKAGPMRLRAITGESYTPHEGAQSFVLCMADISGEIISQSCPGTVANFLIQSWLEKEVTGEYKPEILDLAWELGGIILECNPVTGFVANVYKVADYIKRALIPGNPCADFLRRILGKDKDINVVTSIDPNEKAGSRGYGISGFTRLDDPLFYTIYFENVDSATASAEDITIVDTLDTNFNWKSLAFDSASHKPVATNFDSAKGIVTWTFTAINLPPNKIPPQGEGWVRYHVEPKLNLPHLSQIRNRAWIIFDQNKPISTGLVVNTNDIVKPSSKVKPLPATQADTTFVVEVTGNDDVSGAGIRCYSLYVSDNDSSFKLWCSTDSAMIAFSGHNNHKYKFYSVATDNAGNIEATHDSADAITTTSFSVSVEAIIARLPKAFIFNQNFPNPFRTMTRLQFAIPPAAFTKDAINGKCHVSIKVYDVRGRLVRTLLNDFVSVGNHDVTFNGKNDKGDLLGAGIYLSKMQTANYTKTIQMNLSR
jgi:hypothetical protein